MAVLDDLAASVRNILNREVRAHDKLREILNNDFSLNKKLKLVESLGKSKSTTDELISLIDIQINHFRKYFRWRKKTLKIDMDLKEALLLNKHIVDSKTELTRESLERLRQEVNAISDQQALAVYQELFQATLAEDTIAGQQFAEVNASQDMEMKDLNVTDHLDRNLKKQRALLVEIKLAFDESKAQTMEVSKLSQWTTLSSMLEEEGRFHVAILRNERVLLALEKRLIDAYAAQRVYPQSRRNKAFVVLRNYAIAGSLAALAAYIAVKTIEQYLPAKPGRTASEIQREIDSVLVQMRSGNLNELIKRYVPELQAEISKEIVQKKISKIDEAVAMAYPILTDKIYDLYIQELARQLQRNKVLVELGFNIGYFDKSKTEIKGAIRATLQRRFYNQLAEAFIADVNKNADDWDRFWNSIKMGKDRPGYVGQNEREQMNFMVEKLEPIVSQVFYDAINKTLSLLAEIAKEAAARLAEGFAPDSVREYIRPAIDYFIKYWYLVPLGYVGFAAFFAMLFRRFEKKNLRLTYKEGLMDQVRSDRGEGKKIK